MNFKEIFDELQRFDEEYIPFPPFVVAVDAVKVNLALFRETGIAQHLLVLGESGAGKSSICRWIEQQYPKFTLPDRDVTPVLIVSVPSAATISSMASALLEKLGDPAATTGTVSAKTSRVITLCRACRVEMILFDEAQHIHDRGKATTHYMVGDWLKSLIDQTGVPTVFLGLPRLEQILQVNEQLRRRFSRRIRLALGQSDKSSIHAECLQLFRSLGSCLPLPLMCGRFGWDELGMRLHYASDGRVAYIKKLLATALRIALETEVKEIGPQLLEQAFTEELWWEGVGKLNPFNPEFEFRRLDRGNEPFESGNFSSARKRRKEAVC
ncbi:TniB family NTP-binding protein [Methylomonas sp. BW4-1]|uniref:TniB family NTP-binding protein n=1 Tax=Methylomonas sp. BW4-1 TaxID=3376685 RepID=UPI00404218F6